MKIALVGGTHGNEPVGVEVMQLFQKTKRVFENEYDCFLGNPKAYANQVRYIDSDLNRSFGKNSKAKGYEKQRADELTKEIQGHYDFCIDLHTTTSNMGLTVVVNNTHPMSQKAAYYLKSLYPEIKLIEEDKMDDDSNHLSRLCSAGLIIEVGPVANNVLKGELVLKTHHLVESLLDFDFQSKDQGKAYDIYKIVDIVPFPSSGEWYLHPELDEHDFMKLKKGAPLFINIKGEEILMEEEGPIYPFFINEAAYLENKSAYISSILRERFSVKKSK